MQRPRDEDGDFGSPPPKRSKGSRGGKSKGKGDGKGGSKGGLGNVKRCAFKVLCTDPFAANLIGREGATRAQIEEEAQCSLWISKRDELFPNPSQRLLILHADEPEQVWAALEKFVPKLVEVAERDRDSGETNSPLLGKADNEYVFFVALPPLIRGKLLGTRGANIQDLRERTGAKVFVENEHYNHHQSARIIGSPETILNVLRIMPETIQDEAGSEEFAAWAATRTFDGTKGGKGDRKGDRRDRDDRDDDRRERGGKGGRRDRRDRDRSPDGDRHSGGAPFPEVGGPPLDAMRDLSFEFPPGATDLDHAISCELSRQDVDGLLGQRNEHAHFLQRQTGTNLDISENDGFCKILITGPLLNTYLAHFILMKKLHDNMAPRPQAANAKVADLQAQLAALQSQIESVKRGGRR